MHPILFKIPLFGLFGHEYLPIYSYGVMVALGFLLGSWYVSRQARNFGEDPAKALDLVFYILIAAILGSRILHVLVAEREKFFENPLYLFRIWEGGLVFYGGFIASLLVSVWFFRKHKLPALKFCDFFAPAIALGHAIGRQGCFLAGCCHGRPLLHETWYSVTFPFDPNSLAPSGVPLYPTQLMESGAEFLIFLGLHWVLKRKKIPHHLTVGPKGQSPSAMGQVVGFDGQIISLYLMVYAVVRFLLEFWRGDAERGFVSGTDFSTSQLIAVIMFAFGAGVYLYRRRHA